MSVSISARQLSRAEDCLVGFTLAAAATGAIPVPGASTAIVAENAAMVVALSNILADEVDGKELAAALSSVAGMNVLGKTVFLEGARALGWFAGPLGVGGIMALGSATAALQTWCIGRLAISFFENGQKMPSKAEARRTLRAAEADFDLDALKKRKRQTQPA